MSRVSSNTGGSTLAGVVTFFFLIYPMLGLGYALISDSATEQLTTFLVDRPLRLLLRSLVLASAATFVCTLASIPAALALRRLIGQSMRSVLFSMMAATILTPPMIYAFGWQRLLPIGCSPEFRCVLVWSLWAWPIPAWFLGSTMSSIGRQAGEAASLETRGLPLLLRVILPQLAPAMAISSLVLLVLFLGDYGVPHAFGLSVLATDILSRAASSVTPVEAVVASMPGVAVVLAALVGVAYVWSRHARPDDNEKPVCDQPRWSFPAITAGVYFVIGWMVPMVGLIPKIAVRDLVQSWVVYGGDFVSTLLLAGVAGIVSVVLGLLTMNTRRLGYAALIVAVLWGALPGALVGEALVAGFNRPILVFLYDRWPIMVLAFLLHFGWIGFGTVQLARRMLTQDIQDQAVLDGVMGVRYLWRVFLPNTWPTLVVGAGVVAVLSMGDVAASTLVRVPSFNPIAHVIIEKFHRLEDGMMISLSLNIILVVALVVALIARATRPNELNHHPAP